MSPLKTNKGGNQKYHHCDDIALHQTYCNAFHHNGTLKKKKSNYHIAQSKSAGLIARDVGLYPTVVYYPSFGTFTIYPTNWIIVEW